MWKGCFIAIQDTGIIQQHPLSCQRDDAVPKPGDHLSISKGDRLPGDAKGKGREIESGPKEANGYSKSRESFITEAVSLCDSKPIKQLTPREIKKDGFFSGSWAITLQLCHLCQQRSNQALISSLQNKRGRHNVSMEIQTNSNYSNVADR